MKAIVTEERVLTTTITLSESEVRALVKCTRESGYGDPPALLELREALLSALAQFPARTP